MLAIVSNAAISIRTQIPLEDTPFVSFGYISRSGIVGSFGCSVGDFEETLHFSIVAAQCIYSHQQQGFPFLLILANIFYPFFFFNNHSDGCEVICPCGFDLLFPDGE